MTIHSVKEFERALQIYIGNLEGGSVLRQGGRDDVGREEVEVLDANASQRNEDNSEILSSIKSIANYLGQNQISDGTKIIKNMNHIRANMAQQFNAINRNNQTIEAAESPLNKEGRSRDAFLDRPQVIKDLIQSVNHYIALDKAKSEEEERLGAQMTVNKNM